MILTRGNTVFLLKRTPNGTYPDHWCFPGGKVEDTESSKTAAFRECREECGVIVTECDFLVRMVRSRNNETHVISNFIATKFCGEPRIMEKDKFTKAQWFDLSNLPDKIMPSMYNTLKPISEILNKRDNYD